MTRRLPIAAPCLLWPVFATAMLIGLSDARLAVGKEPPSSNGTETVQSQPNDEEAAYTRSINQRADKIVDALELEDAAKANRVRDLIAGNYRGLRDLQDARDDQFELFKKSQTGNGTASEKGVDVARDKASLKINELHRRFLAGLAVELSPEQIEKVKDGLTYGVVQVTYNRYLELLPELSDEQKREILATLLEAREHAMDGGSSEEKHAIFGKYKGRINNYLSKAGFDLRAAEKELAKSNR